MKNDLVEIEQHLASLSPEKRDAVKAKMREAMDNMDAERREAMRLADEAARVAAAEADRKKKCALFAARQTAALALVAACEPLNELRVSFDRADAALRDELPALARQPGVFTFFLPGQVAALNLLDARENIASTDAVVRAHIK